jgi:hypothetical protein
MRRTGFIDRNKSKYTGSFKTLTLRNVAPAALYERRSVQDPGRGALLLQEEFKQGSGASGADFDELSNIEAFLKTLSGPLTPP